MSPRLGAGVKSVTTDAALAVPGVVKVIPIATCSASGFGVIA